MNKKVILKRRPKGQPTNDDFEVVTEALSINLEPGEILVKVEYLSVDPAQIGKT